MSVSKDAELIALSAVLGQKCYVAAYARGFSCGQWATWRHSCMGSSPEFYCDACAAVMKQRDDWVYKDAECWEELRQAKRARRFEALLTGEG